GLVNDLPRLGRAPAQFGHVVDVEGEQFPEFWPSLHLRKRVSVGGGGDRKTVRNSNFRVAEKLAELSQRRGLAANTRDIAQRERLEGGDILGLRHVSAPD